MEKKHYPNILLITTDQHRGDCYGFEGRNVKTPHLDDMAANGTRFSNCITPNAVCMPARASILTGLLPLTHGAHDNGVEMDENMAAEGFGGQFSKAGYATGFIGKGHFSTFNSYEPTGRPENFASSSRYDENWNGPYAGFNHVEMMISGHWAKRLPAKPPQGLHYERWYYSHSRGDQLNELYQTKIPPDVGAAQTFNSALPSAFHTSTWIADRSIAFLNDNQNKPFCMWASFPDPHHPFDAPEPWSRVYHPDEVDLPKHRTRDFERRPWWHKASMESVPTHTDPEMRMRGLKVTRMPPQTDEQLRHQTANYYGMISQVDHNVGRILVALDDLGLKENTIVIFTSDHGDWLGDHGLILKGPMHYDGLLRVGLICTGPGIPNGKVVKDPVSTLDLAATFYDYCQVPSAGVIHSKSLRPIIERDDISRDFAYNEWYMLPTRCGVELQLRTVRTERYRLTMELASGAGELYDLKNDPFELDNLFDNPSAAVPQKEIIEMINSRPNDMMDPLPPQLGNA